MISKEMLRSIEKNLRIDESIKQEAETGTFRVLDYLAEKKVAFNEVTSVGIVNHLIAMFQRLNSKEELPDLGKDVMEQIDPRAVELSREALCLIEKEKDVKLSESEIALVAIHIQNAMQDDVKEEKEIKMGRPIVVIGDRMGKGQHVADGVIKAGGEAVTIPGMAADMKLGDVMKEKNADLGISFCGSGGAGALNAQNKYGYKCRYGMRSIEEGEKAVNDGVVALGFGFMDKEELGERLVKTWLKKNS